VGDGRDLHLRLTDELLSCTIAVWLNVGHTQGEDRLVIETKFIETPD
jgi:hypothetical protein